MATSTSIDRTINATVVSIWLKYNTSLLLIITSSIVLLTGISGYLVKPYIRATNSPIEIKFPESRASWQVVAPPEDVSFNNGVSLRNSSDSINKVKFALPRSDRLANAQKIKVSGDISVIASQASRSGTAVFAIWFLTADGSRVGYQILHLMPGRYKKVRAQGVATWPEIAETAVIGLVSWPGASSFSVRNGIVETVTRNPAYFPVVGLLLLLSAGWLIALVSLVRSRAPGVRLWLPTLVLVTIVCGAAGSTSFLLAVLRPALFRLGEMVHVNPINLAAMLVKSGHFVMFTLFTLVLLRLRARLNLGITLVTLFVLLMALGTESIQLFLQDRHASFFDVAIDSAGIALALVISWSTRAKRC